MPQTTEEVIANLPVVARVIDVDGVDQVTLLDSATITGFGVGLTDAFGRFRTSETGQRIDIEFLYDKQPDFFDEITNNGTITFDSDTRDLSLALDDAADGSYATMRSHPIPYTPGNGQLWDETGVFDYAAIGGGTAEFFLRTSISGSVEEDVTPQSEWLAASTGVDWTDSHIMSIDFQSLKVGTLRFFMARSGVGTYLGRIDNDNVRNSGYWQLASLPAYWRIYNDNKNGSVETFMEMGYGDEANAVGFRYRVPANASATMRAICVTVKSESGIHLQDMQGVPRAVDTGVSAITVSNTLVPVISIRPRTTFHSVPNLMIALAKSAKIETTQSIKYEIIYGGTLGGAPSWNDVNTTQTMMEYDIAASSITGGVVIDSDFIAADVTTTGPVNQQAFIPGGHQGILGKTVLWNRQNGSHTGILTLACIRTTAADAAVHGGFQWEDLR